MAMTTIGDRPKRYHHFDYREEATGHRYGRCTGDHATCPGCRGDGLDCFYESLSVCKVCGCLEGSLLPFCPGRLVTMDEQDAYYAHYCASTGPFARASTETIELPYQACLAEARRRTSTASPSATKGIYTLYFALSELREHLLLQERLSAHQT
jgi:hypothetical protein